MDGVAAEGDDVSTSSGLLSSAEAGSVDAEGPGEEGCEVGAADVEARPACAFFWGEEEREVETPDPLRKSCCGVVNRGDKEVSPAP